MRLRDWRVKAQVQRAFSAVPGGHHLNFVLQRAMGSFPVSDALLEQGLVEAGHHVDAIRDFGDRPLTSNELYEFGAGFDLHIPLSLWAAGVDHQTVIDIRPLLRTRYAADIARRLAGHPVGAARPHPVVGDDLDIDALARDYGIRYLAPCDATATGLPAGSIDAITSTNTLEHIPRASIVQILQENIRLLRPGGIMSFIIDYTDHHAHFDSTITVYQYLSYSDREWRRYNSDLHHQNRLRHDDYLQLFADAGLVVLSDRPHPVTDDDLAALATVELDERYRACAPERLAIQGAHVVLATR